ncbi:MAG: ThiF family adenylyltransferase [Candidatus Uhrbacteria bacterium]
MVGMRVTVIGIGGVGSHLAEWIARYLAFRLPGSTLTLVDGDEFEERNRARQTFHKPGNKAEVVAERLAGLFPEIRVEAVPAFLQPDTLDIILLEGEIVLVCVDNHATRKLLSDEAGKRQDITVISGGNEDAWGTVQVYLRRDGQDVSPSLSQDHPEIASPQGRAPYELHCDERAVAGEPQVLFANVMAAAVMANAFWRFAEDPDRFVSEVRAGVEGAYTEVAFDIRLNAARARHWPVTAQTNPDAAVASDNQRRKVA